MKQIIDWLMKEEQAYLFEIVLAMTINLLFLGLAALALWPLGRAALVLALAKGYVVFWLTVRLAVGVLAWLQDRFRVNIYDHGNAFIISNLVVGGLLQAGWSAFAALTVRGTAADASTGIAIALYAAAAFSCLAALYPVGAFFQGGIYRFANLILSPLAFLVFCLWPSAARAAFGWYFNFFWT